MTLNEKLKKLEEAYTTKQSNGPNYKQMEERFIKYKREVDARCRNEVESEIRRFKEIEVSAIRLEEAAKYRNKMQEMRNEIEILYNQKLGVLKEKEKELLDKCIIKEKALESAGFEHRQKML